MEQTPTPVEERTNLVHWFTGRTHQVLDELLEGGVRVAALGPAQTAEALQELARLQARITGLTLHLLAHAEDCDLAHDHAATSTAAWLAHTTRLPRPEARRLVNSAKLLGEFEATATAALEGRVDGAQARVIIDAVTTLPEEVTAADRKRAEAHLLDEATQFDALTLKRLARHLHHVIDPDGADAALGRQVAKDDARAAAATSLTLWDDGKGTTHGRFTLPTAHGAMLKVALDALMSPKRPDPIPREVEQPRPQGPQNGTDADRTEAAGAVDGTGTAGGAEDAGGPSMVARPLEEVRGEAFCELLERIPTTGLPESGGLCTVLVTIPLQVLQTGLGIATLSTGGVIGEGTARRLACRAGIIPQVLDSHSVVLDQGRKVRLHTGAQRIAMASRDKTCTADGCSIPASFCHAHHKNPWAQGGHTTVRDGTMLCPRHHRMVHDPRYTTEYRTNGTTCITRNRTRRQ